MTDQIDKNYEHETEKEHAIRDALDLQTVSSAHNNINNIFLYFTTLYIIKKRHGNAADLHPPSKIRLPFKCMVALSASWL